MSATEKKHILSVPFLQKVGHRLRRQPAVLWWAISLLAIALYIWAFYTFSVRPFGFRWKALYGDPHYPEGYDIHGIDISHYQGKIEWDKLRNAMVMRSPLRFVMMKATEGASLVDKCFAENFYQSREHGFIRGAYHYYSTQSSARDQAYFFLDKVKLEVGDLPPVLDVEKLPDGMSTEDFQRDILTWLHIVEDRYHVKPILYTYHNFKEKYLSDARFDDYPYWIAHYYVSKVQYEGKWKFWQHTDAGALPGINGYVDLDIYNGSYYDLKQLTIQADHDEFSVGIIYDSLDVEKISNDQSPSDEVEITDSPSP
jgi:lysozyme